MTRRRIRLLVTLAVGLLMAPLAAAAQPSAKMPRIGFLRPSLVSPCRLDSFAQGLRELGYVEGHNIVIEWRCADGTVERQRVLAVELVQLPLDVFVAVPEPVAMGLVTSLAQPGGNVTGVTNQVGLEFHAKRLELLLEAVPGVTRVAALQQGAMVRAVPARAHIQHAAEEAGRRLGVHLQFVEVDAPDELEGAFAAMRGEGAEALLMFFSPFFTAHRQRLMELAAEHRLPGIFESRAYVEAGGLMSYNVSYAALFRRAASYVNRILKGAKPADLPVEQPTNFEFVINLKTAQALGLTIPPSLLFQANEVIR